MKKRNINIIETKSVKDMLRPEVVKFVYNNQLLMFKQEASLQDINKLNSDYLYDIACQLENKIK